MKRLGVIICDRYQTCAGGKCLRAFRRREGAFARYKNEEIELVGFTTCGGCPGGNVEYAPAEMMRNGAEIIHLATGFLVGYPPCPYIDDFVRFVRTEYDIEMVLGTHPIPTSYFATHRALGTWSTEPWREKIRHVVCDEKMRAKYD
jgi:predicted metal-binding protein